MRTVTCTNHCGACGRHFHSLVAFDMHRVGDFASNDPEMGRHCESPLDLLDKNGEMRLEALTEDGVCRVYEPAEAHVTIWTTTGATERARAVWGAPTKEHA